MKKWIGSFFNRLLTIPFQRIGLLRKAITDFSRRIGDYQYTVLKNKFIQNGKNSKFGEEIRAQIIERFEIIDRAIEITTTPTDGLFFAEAILSMNAEGSIVECGCYTGGSTAKLSIIANLLGTHLVVFDSFKGLPKVDQNYQRDYHTRKASPNWFEGRYAAKLDEVKANIRDYGEISACTFYRGWFSHTLNKANLPDKISCAFTDVDLVTSARECLIAIWPLLSEGGIYFSHDIAFIKVLQALSDRNLWLDELGDFPPVLFGAGFGLGKSSPHLGFYVKGQSLSASYIKSLMLNERTL